MPPGIISFVVSSQSDTILSAGKQDRKKKKNIKKKKKKRPKQRFKAK